MHKEGIKPRSAGISTPLRDDREPPGRGAAASPGGPQPRVPRRPVRSPAEHAIRDFSGPADGSRETSLTLSSAHPSASASVSLASHAS